MLLQANGASAEESDLFWFLTSQWCEAVRSAGCHLPLEWSASLAFLQHMQKHWCKFPHG